MAISRSVLEMVSDVAAISIESKSLHERADAIVDRLREEIPFEAAALSGYDPANQSHNSIAGVDYPSDVMSYLNDGFTLDDPAFLAMRFRHSRPLRWCDIPNYTNTFSAREVFLPSGFREGVTTCLFTKDGRYTGSLHLSTSFDIPLSDAAIDCLAAMRPMLGSLMDSMRVDVGLSWGELVVGAQETALLTADHKLISLPGLYRGPQLDEGSGAMAKILAAAALPGPRAAYWPAEDGRTHLIQVTPLVSGSLVTLREHRPPCGLTTRELEVLELLALGLSNTAIGRELHLSHHTVATHVEHIFGRLQCRSRVVAASIAVALGIVAPKYGA